MKDAGGHGSNGRGNYHNIDKNLNGPGKHVGYANGPWRIEKQGTYYRATHRASGESFSGTTLGAISKGLSDRASSLAYQSSPRDNEARTMLAVGGAKSDPAPVHDSMVGLRDPRAKR